MSKRKFHMWKHLPNVRSTMITT